MGRVRLRSVAVTAFFVLAIMCIGGLAFAAEPTVTVTEGADGGSLTVSGSGFTPGGDVVVEVTVEEPPGVFTTFTITLVADDAGNISASDWRPEGFPTGLVTVVVTGLDVTTGVRSAPVTVTGLRVVQPAGPVGLVIRDPEEGGHELTGGPGNDFIYGLDGEDTITGAGGDDQLWGDDDPEAEELFAIQNIGQSYSDWFVYDLGAGLNLGNDTIWDFDLSSWCETGDTLQLLLGEGFEDPAYETEETEAGVLITWANNLGSVLLNGIESIKGVNIQIDGFAD